MLPELEATKSISKPCLQKIKFTFFFKVFSSHLRDNIRYFIIIISLMW